MRFAKITFVAAITLGSVMNVAVAQPYYPPPPRPYIVAPPPPGWVGPHYYWHGRHWHSRTWAYDRWHHRYWRYQ
ncbi:hypothetical protein HN018_10535 [Lichenicola cladoniae]|jgi:hypothetical protein|uniref:YXWGXW repeat-containing protein n=1 Tax=Lichenicola cladoniae TaxID=1484109 RepID=A0A6M8HQ97_9PROT|nr:hypothetical protein [Lichenicola cladoniae]NPD69709.1 hypothetical protein [Acetobacteraceae bacterium]QKE90411.1 hypothetical protein HN018_10535 [Lichenicola cladoniae]